MKYERCVRCHERKIGAGTACMEARDGRVWPHEWEETEDLCRVFFVVLQFYCDEPRERHCSVPVSDTAHRDLIGCDLAHHEFSPTRKLSYPPQAVIDGA